jgi:hypothetical protein
MKKRKRSDKPTNFAVEDADAAFSKMGDAARRMFAVPQKEIDREIAKRKRAKHK